MSKVTKQQLQQKIDRQETRIDRLVGMLAKKGFYDKSKNLDQSVFDDEPLHLKWAAIEEDGSVYLFAKKPFIDLHKWAAGTDEVEVYTGYMGANKTSFKKGSVPHNHKPVGYERIRDDGYVSVKVAEPNKFRLKQLVVWEAHHGKLKKGYNLRFLDNDRTNCNIDNLMLIPRAVNSIVNNRNPANTQNSDLNKSILLTESIAWHANKMECQL